MKSHEKKSWKKVFTDLFKRVIGSKTVVEQKSEVFRYDSTGEPPNKNKVQLYKKTSYNEIKENIDKNNEKIEIKSKYDSHCNDVNNMRITDYKKDETKAAKKKDVILIETKDTVSGNTKIAKVDETESSVSEYDGTKCTKLDGIKDNFMGETKAERTKDITFDEIEETKHKTKEISSETNDVKLDETIDPISATPKTNILDETKAYKSGTNVILDDIKETKIEEKQDIVKTKYDIVEIPKEMKNFETKDKKVEIKDEFKEMEQNILKIRIRKENEENLNIVEGEKDNSIKNYADENKSPGDVSDDDNNKK